MSVRLLRRWLAVLVTVLALAATGCGGGDGGGGVGPGGGGDRVGADDGDGDDDATPGGGGEKRDGCELVTAADAETILGEPVTEDTEASEAASGFALANCVWQVEDETSFKLLQFSAFEGAQFYGGELFKDDPSYEEVDGLGDGAFFTEALGVQLQVIDGDTVLLFDVSGFNTDPPLDKETVKRQLIDLAKKVLTRL